MNDTHSKPKRRAFKLSELFSIVSLISILVTAVILMTFYRHTAVGAIVEMGEQNNVSLAQSTLNSVRGELVRFLEELADRTHESAEIYSIPTQLEEAIRESMANTSVVRIKIYNVRGLVVFSTKYSQIGQDQSANPRFVRSYEGHVESKLVYRDSFNLFDEPTPEDNTIQTYIPVRAAPWKPVSGVFEIYSDVAPMVRKIERTEVKIVAWVIGILLALYAFLLFVVRRSEKIIEKQSNTIMERTRTLELLSSHMLSAEENERRRIAQRLHEGVAQTLSAIKLRIEHACHLEGDANASKREEITKLVIPEIQRGIQEVRAMAMDLRPPSLDDFGLIPTVAWLKQEFANIYPRLRIETVAQVREQEIPAPMKTIIFRVVQESLTCIAKETQADQVRIELLRTDGEIVLSIENNDPTGSAVLMDRLADPAPESAMGYIKERTMLSGGTFVMEEQDPHWNVIRATWSN